MATSAELQTVGGLTLWHSTYHAHTRS